VVCYYSLMMGPQVVRVFIVINLLAMECFGKSCYYIEAFLCFRFPPLLPFASFEGKK